MAIQVKTGGSTWSPIIAKAKTGASTWTTLNTIYVKTGVSTWITVFGSQDVRHTATQDNTVSGSYSFGSVNLTNDGSLGNTSTYGYSQAVSGQSIGQNFNCDPVLNGNYGEGFTVFSFDPGVSVLQNEAVINIKYKRIGSTAAVSGGSAVAAISYSTDATNNTGGGTYTGIVSCSDNNYDTSVQTFQQTISGPLNRQNFKIKVGSVENLAFYQTALGDCGTPAPYDSGLFSAAFQIYDIYITFR